MHEIDLVSNWLTTLAPPPKTTPADWAEANMRLPSDSNAIPGPIRLFKYQREMINAINQPGVHTAALMLASQTGKSISLNALLGHAIACEPCPILYVSPTEASNTAFVKEKLAPLIETTPVLRELIGANNSTDALTLKQFPGGFLATASSFKPSDLAARAIKLALCDEIDRFSQSAGAEGSPIGLVLKRTLTFRNRLRVLASTPTSRFKSNIAEWHDRGDCRKWHITCKQCGTIAPLAFERLQWPDGSPDQAALVCLDCGHAASERERLDMVADGEWISTNESYDPGLISFQAPALVSPFVSLAAIARESEAADTPEKRRVFVNTVLAETYDSTDEASVDAASLSERAEQLAQPYPKEILFVTAGCDVQANRLELSTVAHLPRNQRLVLDHVVLPGDPSSDDVWRDLDMLLGRPIRLADKRDLPITATAIDAGFSTTRVATFVTAQRAKSRRVYATFGRAGFGRPVWKQGARIARNMTTGYVVGIDDVKLSIMKQLALPVDAPNTIRLPAHLPAEYFDQLASERLTTTYKKGFAKMEWTKAPHARNEALDCLTYAIAVASTIKSPPPATPTANAKPKQSIGERVAQLNALSNKGN